METLIDQSRAYAKLGMLDEVRAAASEVLRIVDMEEILRTWLVILAYKGGDFPHAAALGTDALAHGIKRAHLHDYTALALHHIGQTREATALLLGLEESSHSFLKSYLLACFLFTTGDIDEAVRQVLSGLPDYHDECERTWLDGDLKALWMKLASGDFTLETAHMLIEREFDFLREWQPGIGTKWNLDPANYSALPNELRAVVRFDPKDEAYVIDYLIETCAID